jgi:hypothetical protein
MSNRKTNNRNLAEILKEDLSRSIPDNVIEEATDKIHGEEKKREDEKKPKEEERQEVKLVRVTVDTPEPLHFLIQKILLEERMKGGLRRFYLDAIKEKCERLGYKLHK